MQHWAYGYRQNGTIQAVAMWNEGDTLQMFSEYDWEINNGKVETLTSWGDGLTQEGAATLYGSAKAEFEARGLRVLEK